MSIDVTVYKVNKKEWSEFAKTTRYYSENGEKVDKYELMEKNGCPELIFLGKFLMRARPEFDEIDGLMMDCLVPVEWECFKEMYERCEEQDFPKDWDFENWLIAVLNTLNNNETFLVLID